MTYRSSPSFAVGGVEGAFACVVCGTKLATRPLLEVRGFCEAHCPAHDWEYDRYRRDRFCTICDAERAYEPFDDDVGFASYARGEGPIGTPAGAMDGNAMKAGSDKWNRWVAFCERWGHP